MHPGPDGGDGEDDDDGRFFTQQPDLQFDDKYFFQSASQPQYSQPSEPSATGTKSKFLNLAPCPVCRSTKWRKAPKSGELVCQYGHISTEYRDEHGDVEAQILLGSTHRIKKSLKGRKRRASRAVPAKLHLELFPTEGFDLIRVVTLNVLQWILREQLRVLCLQTLPGIATNLDGPQTFEDSLKTAWSFFLYLVEREDPLVAKLSLSFNLVILQLVYRHHGLPVLLADLVRLANEHKIPFFGIKIPRSLLAPLPLSQRRIVAPRKIILMDSLLSLQYRMCFTASTMLTGYHAWARNVCSMLFQRLGISESQPLTSYTMLLFDGITTRQAIGLSDRVPIDYRVGYVPIETRVASCIAFLLGAATIPRHLLERWNKETNNVPLSENVTVVYTDHLRTMISSKAAAIPVGHRLPVKLDCFEQWRWPADELFTFLAHNLGTTPEHLSRLVKQFFLLRSRGPLSFQKIATRKSHKPINTPIKNSQADTCDFISK